MQAPDNEVPVALALNVLLARTDDIAVALTGLQVYRTGVSFTLVARSRSEDRDLNTVFWDRGPGDVHGRLLFGVEFADGRRTHAGGPPRPGGQPDDLVLTQGSGSGGDRSIDQTWWLHPLPPAGPLTFVVRCPDLGIPETQVQVDATPFDAAAADVVELWPWTPPPQYSDEPPPEIDLPADSWFRG